MIALELNNSLLGYKKSDLKTLFARSWKLLKTMGGYSLGKLLKKDNEAFIFDDAITNPMKKDKIK